MNNNWFYIWSKYERAVIGSVKEEDKCIIRMIQDQLANNFQGKMT